MSQLLKSPEQVTQTVTTQFNQEANVQPGPLVGVRSILEVHFLKPKCWCCVYTHMRM